MMISIHIQDAQRGVPAARIPVELDLFNSAQGWIEVGHGISNTEGDIEDFGEHPTPGIYRLMFDIASYHTNAFFPSITVPFEVRDSHEPHHIELVLSPFGYSVHRGI